MQQIKFTKYGRAIYFLFPLVSLIVCLLIDWISERFFGVGGLAFFLGWPGLLLFWLIYWGIKVSEVTTTVLYLGVALVCTVFIMADLWGFVVGYFHINQLSTKNAKEYCIYWVPWVVIVTWGVNRWLRKRRAKSLTQNQAS